LLAQIDVTLPNAYGIEISNLAVQKTTTLNVITLGQLAIIKKKLPDNCNLSIERGQFQETDLTLTT